MDDQPRHGLLTPTEIEALPEDLRDYYSTNEGLRDVDDLQFFPEAKRASIQGMIARLTERTLTRIAEQEHRHAS